MNFDKLDAFMREMPQRGFPASELAVSKDGKTVYRTAVGFADAAGTRKTSRNDLYWIYSASKPLTCVAAMRLVEEGKLSLDDNVSKYLPEYAHLTVMRNKGDTPVPATVPMKIIHLFTMTGGMSYDLGESAIKEAAGKDGDTLALVRAMAKIPLRFEPGEHYRYSLCHDVLAAVVEVVSGMRFGKYLKKIIFDPLGMEDTGFVPTEEQYARFSTQYRYRLADGTATPVALHNIYRLAPRYESGGAGIFSKTDDYLKFVTVLALGGTAENGYRLLRPETVAMLEENRLDLVPLGDMVTGRLYGYGWGLCGRVHVNPTYSLSKTPVGEFGWDGAAGAYCSVDRKNRVAFYFGTHVLGATYAYHLMHPMLRNLVYEALEI